MRVLVISKACVVGMYQRKLEELARFPDIELFLVVPPAWRERGRVLHLEKMYTSGYQLHVLPIVFNGHFHVHFYRGLRALIRRVQPHIVHIEEEPYNLATFQAMCIAQMNKAQALFFTWQNLLRRYPFPFSAIERYNFTRAACAIAGNEEARDVLLAKGYRRTIHVLPQFGVDPFLYRKMELPPREENTFVIGYAGRLVEEKGVQVLLSAAAGLPGNWRLQIVGDGPYRPTLEALAKTLGIEERVIFELSIPSGEMPYFLNKLNVLVLPSLTRRNWKEQFGRVLIEAMACEVPVIGSSSGEIPHLIAEAGLVFPEGHAEALREALHQLMSNPELCAELGQRGRTRVLTHYTQQRIAAETYAIYRQLLEAP